MCVCREKGGGHVFLASMCVSVRLRVDCFGQCVQTQTCIHIVYIYVYVLISIYVYTSTCIGIYAYRHCHRTRRDYSCRSVCIMRQKQHHRVMGTRLKFIYMYSSQENSGLQPQKGMYVVEVAPGLDVALVSSMHIYIHMHMYICISIYMYDRRRICIW